MNITLLRTTETWASVLAVSSAAPRPVHCAGWHALTPKQHGAHVQALATISNLRSKGSKGGQGGVRGLQESLRVQVICNAWQFG